MEVPLLLPQESFQGVLRTEGDLGAVTQPLRSSVSPVRR